MKDPRNPLFTTYTGRRINILDPKPGDISLEDIAQGLSLQTRFNGQCRDFYSVAQHSVLLSQNVSRENMLVALMHDATEAYVGDCITPLKKQLPLYQAVEELFWKAIAVAFGLPEVIPEEVKVADKLIYGDERSYLFMLPTKPRLDIQIDPWGWKTAKRRFLNRFEELVDEAA